MKSQLLHFNFNINYRLMKKSFLLILLLLNICSHLSAQTNYYLRGEAAPCGWGGNFTPTCQLTDPDNDGIFTLTIDLGAALGYKEFKIWDQAADSWWPGANSWFNHTGGNITFRYQPATNQVDAIDGTGFSICAPGEFTGWNNAAAMTNVNGNIWCFTIPNAGSYQWKPTRCGQWGSWEPFNGTRSTNSSNWSITTTSANEQVCVEYNPADGRLISTAPPPTGYYLRGTATPCDWNNVAGGCELTDPDGDGCYEITLNLGNTALGLQEFKVYHADNNEWLPTGGNVWYNHQGGSLKFKYCTASGEVQIADGFDFSVCAPGEFSGWNNAFPMENFDNGVWCINIPTPGTYEWKPTLCGTWNSWQPTNGTRNQGANNWKITTTQPNQQVCVTYDQLTGYMLPGSTNVPTMTQWGLLVFGLMMLVFGIVTVRQRKVSMAGGEQNTGFSFRNMPFNRSIFTFSLFACALATMLTFVIAALGFGYEMTGADLPGSMMAVPLFAYLIMLVVGEKSEK